MNPNKGSRRSFLLSTDMKLVLRLVDDPAISLTSYSRLTWKQLSTISDYGGSCRLIA